MIISVFKWVCKWVKSSCLMNQKYHFVYVHNSHFYFSFSAWYHPSFSFLEKGTFIKPLLHCTCVSEKYSGTHTIKNLRLQILELRVDVEFLKREIKCVNHCCDSVLKPRSFVFWIITALICLTFSKREIRSSSITDSGSVSISQGKVRLL